MASLFDHYSDSILTDASHRAHTMPPPPSAPQDFSILSIHQPPAVPLNPSSSNPMSDPKKRHACPTCSRAFTTSGHLARHIRVHTGERNHKCPFPGCETRCSRQDNLQQHYRIHLSPGSRRSSSTRSRTETKKKSGLSTSLTTPIRALHSDEPPDSPPPLARATILPPAASESSHPPVIRGSYHQLRPEIAHRTHSSPSGSSAGSPHSSYASVSPGVNATVPHAGPSGHAGTTTHGSPFNNLLGLSHERTHSPSSAPAPPNEYPTAAPNTYPSYSSTSYHHRAEGAYSMSTPSYPSSSSSYSSMTTSNTLPPIHAVDPHANSTAATSNLMGGLGLGLGRIASHSTPYSYETPSQWHSHGAPAETPSYSHAHNNWWASNASSVGVVGAQRGYAQTYGS